MLDGLKEGANVGPTDGLAVGSKVGYAVGEAVGAGFTVIEKVVTGSCVPSAFTPATVIVKVPAVLPA
jgi:hypothetical protein